jgi:hypothetical protein
MRAFCLIGLFAFALQSTAQQPVATNVRSKSTAIVDFVPPKLKAVHDPISAAVQKQRMLTKNEEAKFLASVQSIMDDVTTASKRPNRELPVKADAITVRSPVLKTIKDRDVAKTFLIVANGSLKTCTDSVLLAYGDIKVARAKNCVIVAGRIAEVEDAENCVILAGAAKIDRLVGANSGSVGESRPITGNETNILVARSWLVATNIGDSIVWGVSAKPKTEHEAASVTITKANRVVFLTPPTGRTTGTEANCSTQSPPDWPKN